MKGDQIGTLTAHPRPQELSLSNWTWFNLTPMGRFPPQDLPHRSSKHLTFPPVIDPAAPPIRPERHVPNSIATMRRRLTVALARRLERCPCCLQTHSVGDAVRLARPGWSRPRFMAVQKLGASGEYWFRWHTAAS